jgi:hypothetical protein
MQKRVSVDPPVPHSINSMMRARQLSTSYAVLRKQHFAVIKSDDQKSNDSHSDVQKLGCLHTTRHGNGWASMKRFSAHHISSCERSGKRTDLPADGQQLTSHRPLCLQKRTLKCSQVQNQLRG